MKIQGFIFLLLILPLTLHAEAVGDKNGLLQQMTHEQVNQRIHDHLTQQIKIENPQPYTANQTHNHHAVWGCTKAVQHKHAGSRNHRHNYGNCNRRFHHHSGRPAPRRAAPRPAAVKAAPQASSTNVQEQGVDEADYVKTDGRYLYAIENANSSGGIRIYDTQHQGDQLKQVAAIGFGKDMQLQGMYLLSSQNKLVVIGQSYRNKVRSNGRNWGRNTSIIVVDIRNKARPRTLRHTRLEGNPKTTRRIGNQLYLVLNSYSFSFPSTYKYLETPKPLTTSERAAVKQEIVDDIKQWSIQDRIPYYRTPGKPGAHPLIPSGNFYLNPHDLTNWNLTTLLAIDLSADAFRFKSMGWFGEGWGTTVYASQKAMYITSGYYSGQKTELNKTRFPKDLGNRLIHKFAFKNKGFDYRGSGAVLGNFKWTKLSSFQLDEDQKGNLRVVTYNNGTSRQSKDPATQSPVVLTAMREHPTAKHLITLDRLPNKTSPKALGKPGEQLYGARMFDDYAYFVTFKRTDPLYVVDLRNPERLKVTGELIIPGFSDYLHPLGNGLLLGIGKEAKDDGRTWAQLQGLKLSLYDVRNPKHPREIHKIVVGKRGTDSPANRDHHAFTSLAMQGTHTTRVALPVSLVGSEDNYNRKDGLHRFEIDRKKRRITHLGAMNPLNGNSKWAWYSNDRSIIIGDRLYYYHDGHFWQGNW